MRSLHQVVEVFRHEVIEIRLNADHAITTEATARAEGRAHRLAATGPFQLAQGLLVEAPRRLFGDELLKRLGPRAPAYRAGLGSIARGSKGVSSEEKRIAAKDRLG